MGPRSGDWHDLEACEHQSGWRLDGHSSQVISSDWHFTMKSAFDVRSMVLAVVFKHQGTSCGQFRDNGSTGIDDDRDAPFGLRAVEIASCLELAVSEVSRSARSSVVMQPR